MGGLLSSLWSSTTSSTSVEETPITDTQRITTMLSHRMDLKEKIDKELNQWSVDLYSKNIYLPKIPEQARQNKYKELCKKYNYNPYMIDTDQNTTKHKLGFFSDCG